MWMEQEETEMKLYKCIHQNEEVMSMNEGISISGAMSVHKAESVHKQEMWTKWQVYVSEKGHVKQWVCGRKQEVIGNVVMS